MKRKILNWLGWYEWWLCGPGNACYGVMMSDDKDWILGWRDSEVRGQHRRPEHADIVRRWLRVRP